MVFLGRKPYGGSWARTGVTQVVYGSDIPYLWPDTIDTIVDAPFLTDDAKEAIWAATKTPVAHRRLRRMGGLRYLLFAAVGLVVASVYSWC